MSARVGRARLWLVVVGAALLACGGQTAKSGTGGGGSGGSGGSTGGSGGAGGTTGGSGGSGGSGGNPQCAELEQEYADYLAQAKSCNSLINSLQCTESIDDSLACPCPTYVNPANADAVAKLEQLQTAWDALPCQVPCPLLTCPAPQGSGCVPNGGGGDADGCQDFWPD